MDYLNVIELPEIDLNSVNRLLVIDSEDNLKSLNKSDLTVDLSDYATKSQVIALEATKQDKLISGDNIKTINSESLLGTGNIQIDFPFVIFPFTESSGNLGESGIKVYNAIKQNKGFYAWLEVQTSKIARKCEYLLPVGLDNSKDIVKLRFEHIHYSTAEGTNIPQSLERFTVNLSADGSYTYEDESSLLAIPTIYLQSDGNVVVFSNQLTAQQAVGYLTNGNPIQVSYTKLGEQTIHFTSFKNPSLLATIAYGIDGENLYTATINLSKKTFTMTSRTI